MEDEPASRDADGAVADDGGTEGVGAFDPEDDPEDEPGVEPEAPREAARDRFVEFRLLTTGAEGRRARDLAMRMAIVAAGEGRLERPHRLERALRRHTTNATGRTRTFNPRLRRPVLYPVELQSPENALGVLDRGV